MRMDLTGRRQKPESSHPLARTQPYLAHKVVEVMHEPLEDIFGSRVRVARVDEHDVFGDVLSGEILDGWDLDLGGIHLFLSL